MTVELTPFPKLTTWLKAWKMAMDMVLVFCFFGNEMRKLSAVLLLSP